MTPVPELAQIATMLAARIRDDDPQANAAWLAEHLPDPGDWFRLAFVLAAAVPDDRTWGELTAWTRPRPARQQPAIRHAPTGRQLRPHGTPAAVARHKYHREPLCDPCRDVERARIRDRSARRRAIERDLTPTISGERA
jgi:hypothetical protein